MEKLFTDNISSGNVVISIKNEKERSCLRDFLRGDGYDVYICLTIEDFMAISYLDFKCIIVDVTLGHESTFHAIEMLKQSNFGSRMPLLVIADVSSTDNVVRALNAGANDYILRPYSRKEMLQCLHALISRFPA